MNDVAVIDNLEAEMLALPQVACPVVHHFGPGIYIREVTLPAGALAVGHRQRFWHTNIMLKGRVSILQDNGDWCELVAPLFFVGKPGRKVGFVTETVVWQNVYATEETDIDKLEATYLDKSPVWEADSQKKQLQAFVSREADRIDYFRLLEEAGISHELALAQSENESDQLHMHCAVVRILPSPIDGRGVFVSSPFEAGEVIAPARLGIKRTPVGRFTNHSATPNAQMVQRPHGDIDLVATRRIEGCRGGDPGEEVTIDYRQALGLSGIAFKETACLP